jgi:hypothetical protein
MDIGSIFLILALLILVVVFITRPLFDRKVVPVADPSVDERDHELSSLLAERDRLLNALQELDFDHAMGKIPEEDYPAQRTLLLTQAAAVLQKLDELQADSDADEMERRLEAAIAARRATVQPSLEPAQAELVGASTAASIAPADDDLEVLLARRRRERQGKAAGFCPKCGGPIQQTDRFCPKCGAAIV